MIKAILTSLAVVILCGVTATTCSAQRNRGGWRPQQAGGEFYPGNGWQNQSAWNNGWQNYPQQTMQFQQQLNEIGRNFQFQTQMDRLQRETDTVRAQGAVQNFMLEAQRKRLRDQQQRLEDALKKAQAQQNSQPTSRKPYPRLDPPRTLGQSMADGRVQLGRGITNGRDFVGREISNGRTAVGREISNGRSGVGRELSNARDGLGREMKNLGNTLFGR